MIGTVHAKREVREAMTSDVPAMAALADAKRQQYRDHAAPFQRPAADARAVHERFLPKLLEWDDYDVLVHEKNQVVDGFIVSRRRSASPPFGEGSLFHVDDFAVQNADWDEIGTPLLDAVAAIAMAAGIAEAIVVSGPDSVDGAKPRFSPSAASGSRPNGG
jgi:hypothetical protein